jgi:hypothetical protein
MNAPAMGSMQPGYHASQQAFPLPNSCAICVKSFGVVIFPSGLRPARMRKGRHTSVELFLTLRLCRAVLF